MSGAAIGIDLGTTFCAVAHVPARGVPEIVPNAEGASLTPSVWFMQGDEVLVGSFARDAGAALPGQVIAHVKRHMGDDAWRFVPEGGSRAWSAVELSAAILRTLRRDAELHLGEPVTHAVITVPAYFGERERRATVRAGQEAGLEVLALLNEPTAAAFAYGLAHPGPERRVLVLDLGGGTCDASVVGISGRDIGVVATTGDPALGGNDWDDVLVAHVAEAFVARHGIDPRAEPVAAHALRRQCVAAKLALTRRERTSVSVDAGGRSLRLELDRATFEALSAPLVDRFEALGRHALRESGLRPEQVERVVLAGGATRMPMVRARVASAFGQEPDTALNPDECVAMGAALLAAMERARLAGERAPVDLRTRDVTGHTLGVLARRGDTLVHVPMIPRQSPLPATRTLDAFVATAEGPGPVDAWLVQGESEDPRPCVALAMLGLDGLPPRGPGDPPQRLTITVRYSADGLVEVEATGSASGERLAPRVAPTDVRPADLADGCWPADTVVVLDASGSMYGPAFEAARTVVARFLQDSRGPNRRAALVISPSGEATALAADVASALGLLRSAVPVGPSPLAPALLAAEQLLAGSVCAQRTILLVGDGQPDDPEPALTVARRLLASGCRLRAVAAGAVPDAAWWTEVCGDPPVVAPEVPVLQVTERLPRLLDGHVP
ncbi:MAG: hypothetical protein RLZZ299_2870 [Pseudomonadota bacterium]